MAGLTPQARNAALVVAGATFMQFIDSVMIVTALPVIARDFAVEPLAVTAGITVYLLTSAAFISMGSWISGRFGARRVFIGAVVVFTLASLACALSQTLGQFVAARALQGIGGALMVPVGRIIVLQKAEKEAIVEAVAVITWPGLMAPVVGPALGGLLTTYVGWESIFFINIPLGIAAIVLILRLVPPDGEPALVPFDWIGFASSSSAMLALIWGLESAVHGFMPLPLSIGLVVAGLACGIFAVRWLLGVRHPLVDIRVFAVPTFAQSTLSGGWLFRMTASATPFLLPLLFQFVFGLDAFQSGFFTAVYFIGNLVMKTATTRLLRRFGFRGLMFVNGLISTTALAACALVAPGVPVVIVGAILLIAGMTRSMQFTAVNTLAFADLTPAQRSSGSTLSTMMHQIASLGGIVVATVSLSASTALRGGGPLILIDFQTAFIVLAALALVASLLILGLAKDAGSEVSGHRRLPAAQ